MAETIKVVTESGVKKVVREKTVQEPLEESALLQERTNCNTQIAHFSARRDEIDALLALHAAEFEEVAASKVVVEPEPVVEPVAEEPVAP